MSLCQYVWIDEEQIVAFLVSKNNIVERTGNDPCSTSIETTRTSGSGDELVVAELVSTTSKLVLGNTRQVQDLDKVQ